MAKLLLRNLHRTLLFDASVGMMMQNGCGHETTPKWRIKLSLTPDLAIFDPWGGLMAFQVAWNKVVMIYMTPRLWKQ